MILLTACTGYQAKRGEEVAKFSAPISPTYQKQTFQLDLDGGLPIASVPGSDDDVWFVTEFGDSLHHITTGQTIGIERLTIPMNVNRGQYPFVGDENSRFKVALSERIVKDNQGRLWFAQNGSWFNAFHTQDVNNHSRIVSYDPRVRQFCVYPVPDNNAAVMGVAWDEARNLVWFAQTGNNMLVAFNPDKLRNCKTYNRYRWEFNNRGELAYAFPVSYCKWSGEVRCFRKFPLHVTGKVLPNQLTVQQPGQPDAGAVWITEYAGGHIGRFDTDTEKYQRFPIDTDRKAFKALGLKAAFYHRAHQILTHPVTGDLVFSTNGTGQVFRFDIRQYLDNPNRCRKLDSNGFNPCMYPIQVSPFKGYENKGTTHSISFDRFGNLWVSTWLQKCPVEAPPPSIGFIDANWQQLIYFGDMKLLPQAGKLVQHDASDGRDIIECADNGWPPWGFKGISVDRANNVWFANFFQRLVYKLSYTAGTESNPYDLFCDEQCRLRN